MTIPIWLICIAIIAPFITYTCGYINAMNYCTKKMQEIGE